MMFLRTITRAKDVKKHRTITIEVVTFTNKHE
jgi:hypothetical protein